MHGYLHLTDGTTLKGVLRGFIGNTEGEVVFSTGMTGYTQSLTDPSFAGQILTFTYPLIGNYGVPKPQLLAPHLVSNFESERIWAKGVVCSEIAEVPSHYQSVQSFDHWCSAQKIPILTSIDTRALTQKLRETGTLMAQISKNSRPPDWKSSAPFNYQQVSIDHTIFYPSSNKKAQRIALIDCGVKHGILRALLNRGYAVTRIPWNINPLDVGKFDGVFCSNGPGDPKDWKETVENIKKVVAKKIPFIGVCLGHQLLALAIGADTYKLKYGHRGLNQPCQDLSTQKCYLTSQNHGYAVETKTIPASCEAWFKNLNDDTNEGLRSVTKKIWTVQFHPEGSPGPSDTEFIFDTFKQL